MKPPRLLLVVAANLAVTLAIGGYLSARWMGTGGRIDADSPIACIGLFLGDDGWIVSADEPSRRRWDIRTDVLEVEHDNVETEAFRPPSHQLYSSQSPEYQLIFKDFYDFWIIQYNHEQYRFGSLICTLPRTIAVRHFRLLIVVICLFSWLHRKTMLRFAKRIFLRSVPTHVNSVANAG